MKSVYLNFILFLSPFLIILAWGEIQVYKVGETVPFKTVIDRQLSNEHELYYYRQLLNNNINAYKIEMINRKKPDIVTLGQSIVLNFRDFMFHPIENKFYNGGHLVNNINDIEHVVELWKEEELHRPKMVIFGLDAGIPKKNNYLDKSMNFLFGYSDRAYDLNSHMHALQNYYKYTLFGDNQIPKGDPNLGFGYFGQLGNGYRKDGSFHMAKRTVEYIKDPVFTDDRNSRALFDAHKVPFSGEWEIDTAKTARMLQAFADMKAMGMEVIIFTPPSSEYFFDYCFTNDEFLVFWKQFVQFEEQIIDTGYPMFRLRKPQHIGLDDRFMQDAYHPGEVIIALQFLEFLESGAAGSNLLQKINTNHLRERLRAPNTFPLSFLNESPLLMSHLDTIPRHDSIFEAMKPVESILTTGFPPAEDYPRIIN